MKLYPFINMPMTFRFTSVPTHQQSHFKLLDSPSLCNKTTQVILIIFIIKNAGCMQSLCRVYAEFKAITYYLITYDWLLNYGFHLWKPQSLRPLLSSSLGVWTSCSNGSYDCVQSPEYHMSYKLLLRNLVLQSIHDHSLFSLIGTGFYYAIKLVFINYWAITFKVLQFQQPSHLAALIPSTVCTGASTSLSFFVNNYMRMFSATKDLYGNTDIIFICSVKCWEWWYV